MEAYIFDAALLCEDCGASKRKDLNAEAFERWRKDEAGQSYNGPAIDLEFGPDLAMILGFDPEDEASYDSGDYPKGPYADGGGEADSPQHCDTCGVFLANPLTEDGREYVLDHFLEYFTEELRGNSEVIETWRAAYADTLDPAEVGRAFLESLEDTLESVRLHPGYHDSAALYIGPCEITANFHALRHVGDWPNREEERIPVGSIVTVTRWQPVGADFTVEFEFDGVQWDALFDSADANGVVAPIGTFRPIKR